MNITPRQTRDHAAPALPNRTLLSLGFPAFHRLAVILSMAALCVTAQAEVDVTAPEVISFVVSPTTVNTASGGQYVTVTARVTDDLSGLNNLQAIFYAPDFSVYASAYMSSSQRISGTANDGIYQANIYVPQYGPSGNWQLNYIYMSDGVSNTRYYYPASQNPTGVNRVFPAGTTETLSVTTAGTLEKNRPALTALSFTPNAVDVTAASANVTVTATATDDSSGVNNIYMQFLSPSRTQSRGVGFSRTAGTTTNGTWTGTLNMPRYAEAGTWTLDYFYVRDAASNYQYYYAARHNPGAPNLLIPGGFPTTLEVTDATPDAQAPLIQSFSATPTGGEVSASGQTITFTVTATDNLMGIGYVQASFRSPTGRQSFASGLSLLSGTSLSGTYRGSATIPQYSEAGDWKLDYIYITDNFQTRYYYPSTASVSPPSMNVPAGSTEKLVITNGLGPAVITGAASSITNTSATVGGTVDPRGAATTWYFEYGTTDTFGSQTTSTVLAGGAGLTTVSKNLTSLQQGTLYYYRLVGSSVNGTAYGSDGTFWTTGTRTTNQGSALSMTNFIVAAGAGVTETYNNNGNNITVSGYSSVGAVGTGVMNHANGTHSTPILYVGEQTGSTGTYNLGGGAISVSGAEVVGQNGPGTFTQTGGSNSPLNLYLGFSSGVQGTYSLQSGSLTVGNTLAVGHSGTGALTQSGGSIELAAGKDLILAANAGSQGTFSANGGTVIGRVLEVGSEGAGALSINGGTLTFETLRTKNGSAAITFAKGTVNATNSNVDVGANGLIVGNGTDAASLNLGDGTHSIANGVHVKNAAILALANSRGGAMPVALEGGTLTGHGTVGTLSATSGSVIDPGGASAAAVVTGSVTLAAGVNCKVDLISGASDQLNVTGAVTLAGATLSVTLHSAPAIGQTFTIVQNDDADAVDGAFSGLPQGTILSLTNTGAGGGAYNLQLSYAGGTGNDVTLTVVGTVPVDYASTSDVPVTANGFTATGSTVSFSLSHEPMTGANLLVVKNTGLGFISGTFSNLAHGQVVQLSFGGVTYRFVANYFGGTGNDLVLQWANTRPVLWGANSSGQLGNNSTAPSSELVAPDMTGALAGKTVIAWASGQNHTLALCSDGTLAAWGSNSDGQLGNNSKVDSLVPVTVTTDGTPLAGRRVIAIAAGTHHNVALCSDGTLAAWGWDGQGQLGDNVATTPTLDALVPVAVVTAGTPLAGRQVVGISAGGSHTLALCSDGTVAAWGWNGGEGQLGNNSTGNSGVPVAVDRTGVLAGKTVVAISAGATHSLGLCSDGLVVAWGNGNNGLLGNGGTDDSLVPVAVNAAEGSALHGRTVIALAAGSSHSLALCSDGTLAAWGANSFGQLGNNSPVNSSLPVAVVTAGTPLQERTVSAVSVGSAYSLVRGSDGTLAAWGQNAAGQLGTGDTTNSPVPVSVDTSSLATGERFLVGTSGGPSSSHSLGIVAVPALPSVTTLAATPVTPSAATLKSTVNPSGLATNVHFLYSSVHGLVSGVTTTADLAGGSGTGPVSVSQAISGLLPRTTYYFRAVGTNAAGTTEGEILHFTTGNTSPVAGTGTGGVTTGETVLVTLPFTTPDVDGDTVTVTGTPTASDEAPFTLGAVVGNQIEVTGLTNAAGVGTISFTISDGFGGTAEGSVEVTVTDNDAPVVIAPGPVTQSTKGPEGRALSFSASSAVDAVDGGAIFVTYSPASGSMFPIGRTLVTIRAEDAAHNVATSSFVVTITPGTHDTAPPVVKVTSPSSNPTGSPITIAGTVMDNYGLNYLRVKLNGKPAQLDVPLENPLSVDFPRGIEKNWLVSGVVPENGMNFIEVEAQDLRGLVTTVTKTFTLWRQRPGLAGVYPALVKPEGTPGVATSGLVALTVLNTGAFSGKVMVNGAEIPVMGVLSNDGTGLLRGASGNTEALPLVTVERTLLKKVAGATMRTVTRQHGTLSLQVSEGDGLKGVLTDGAGPEPEVLASFSGKKAPYSKANTVAAGLLNLPADAQGAARGYYTVALAPGSPEDDDDGEGLGGGGVSFVLPPGPVRPPGDGYATLTLNGSGSALLAGYLADGTSWTAGALLRSDGTLAVFSPLYGKRGGVAGEVKFDLDQQNSDVGGNGFLWIRPVQPAALQYVVGWPHGVYLDAAGAKFTGGPAALSVGQGPVDPVLGNVRLVFTDGLLSAPVMRRANVDAATGVVTKVPETTLDYTLQVSSTSGVISGTFQHTDGTVVGYRGIVLTKGANRGGFGYFLSNGDGGEGGWFTLEASLPD